MQIHQSANSIGGKIYNAFSYRDHGWGTHIHKCYELVLVKNGTLTATLNGEKLMVKKGEALLIPPYFLHSFSKNTDCTYLIIVFSANYVPSFDNKLKNLQSENHIINFEQSEWDLLEKTLFPNQLQDGQCVLKQPNPDEFAIKSCLYLVASRYMNSRTLSPKNKDYSLLVRIVSYIEENFTQDLTLSSLAQSVGYDDEYVSRSFNRVFNINLKTLINMYRCEYAQNLIETTDTSLTEIAMNSGFQSIRSFNRVFRQIVGKNPSSLRK